MQLAHLALPVEILQRGQRGVHRCRYHRAGRKDESQKDGMHNIFGPLAAASRAPTPTDT